MTQSRLVIRVTDNTIEFPEEIDNTHRTLTSLFKSLESDGVIVNPDTVGTAEERALSMSLCG